MAWKWIKNKLIVWPVTINSLFHIHIHWGAEHLSIDSEKRNEFFVIW